MYKTIHSLLFVSLSAVATASAQAADTSRIFFEQTATTLSKGDVSVDLEYSFISAGVATGIRAGAFGGEIMLNSASDTHTGFANSSIGYKKSIGKGLAAYGIVSYFDDGTVANSSTNIAVGAAYTMKSGDITLNINPELVSDDSIAPAGPRAGKNTVFVKGLAAYKLKQVPVSLVAEVILDNNAALERVINLGARWQPKKNLTVDMIVYSDLGSSGVAGANVEYKSIPGYVIVNYLF
ncbi:MAG: hypothetical protein ABUK13_01710 [Gammaproteobacteria bacterium]